MKFENGISIVGRLFTFFVAYEQVNDFHRRQIGYFLSKEKADKAVEGKGWFSDRGEVEEINGILTEDGRFFLFDFKKSQDMTSAYKEALETEENPIRDYPKMF